jgi:DNA-binding XRE family transcriptional regulator
MMAKSRDAIVGERNPHAKLTEEKVKSIRLIRKTKGLTETEIAEIFDVSRGTINDVLNDRTWGHVC